MATNHTLTEPIPNTVPNLRQSLRNSDVGQKDLLTERVAALHRNTQNTASALNETLTNNAINANNSYSLVRHKMHRGLLELLNPQAVANASMEQIRGAIEEYIATTLEAESVPLTRIERMRLQDDLLYEVLGLGPLSPLMSDATISEIMVNGPHHIFVERHGILELTSIKFHDSEHLMLTIERILSRFGRRVDESSPMADGRLADGSRVNVIIPPLAMNGPTVSIRRFMKEILRIEELVAFGSMSQNAAEFLKLAVKARLNIVVSGGTGSGKTTMLNCLSQYLPEDERIITIEDTAELQLKHEHLVRLEARPSNNEGKGLISIRDLVRNTLRMRPDRIIVGEVRGAEALDMLQAMNTGHDGSLATVHSNSPRDTLSRLETLMLMAELDLPQRVLREQIGSALQLIVHVNRYANGQRKIANITEVAGVDNGIILMQDLFTTKREGTEMVMRGNGVVPSLSSVFAERGIELDSSLFSSDS
ncbi:MAG: CpaF family protein [Methylotenera sp.]|nr:CpaF family protein [Methylotenera sp.]